jgi:hypothetical protein
MKSRKLGSLALTIKATGIFSVAALGLWKCRNQVLGTNVTNIAQQALNQDDRHDKLVARARTLWSYVETSVSLSHQLQHIFVH